MRLNTLITSALATLVAADSSNTTVKYFGLDSEINTYGADPGAYTSTAAHVVGSDSTATTYEIGCLKGADKCALPHPVTLIQGSATYSLSGEYTIETMGATGIITDIEECTFTHTSESVSCSWSVAFTVSSGDVTFSTSDSHSSSSIAPESVSWRTLDVTADAGAITGAAATGTTTAGATSTGAAAHMKPLITAAPMGAAVAAIVAMI